jgi:vitamin B12 transporter
LSSTGTYGLASNLSSVNTRGFEIDFTGSKKVSEKIDIRWMSGMVWLNSKTPAGVLPSFYLSSHAKFIWNGSVQINLNKTSLSISSLYKKRNEQKASSINATITPNYFLLNAKLEQQVTRKKVKLFFQLDNMLDVKYSDLLGAKMPGRWVSGGISFTY